jgi:indolepyruvate ferredoxin oxidoreductase beta subunit
MNSDQKSFGILVAALGGEGGGVLADWLVHAATTLDYPVQSTSIPGVAQRTGATTYYIELYPAPRSELGTQTPVFALMPSPGRVDLVAATELVEAGRVVQNGFTHAERTTLIASSHREYAVAEKVIPGDGRFNSQVVMDIARTLSKQVHLFDMRALAMKHGTVINSVLFGAMAGSGVLPLSREACEQAISASGKAVRASLAGFAAGFDAVAGKQAAASAMEFSAVEINRVDANALETKTQAVEAKALAAASGTSLPPALQARVQALPLTMQDILGAGVAQLVDYQDATYAGLYLDRAQTLLQAMDGSSASLQSAREAARYLALWMSYEDVIRVADLKSRRSRLERVRAEVGATADDPLQITEFLKPGLDELCSVLPRGISEALRRRYAGREHSLNVGIHLRSDTIVGFALLCVLRSLRSWRLRSWRFAKEQEAITRWLQALTRAARLDPQLTHELALAGNVVKGYGETSERGHRNLERMLTIAEKAGPGNAAEVAQQVREERLRALSEGETPTPTVGGTKQTMIKPISFIPRKSSARSD